MAKQVHTLSCGTSNWNGYDGGMELKPYLLSQVVRSFELLQFDLEAIPEEDFNRCFGGQARTAADLVYELNMVNDHVGLTIRGEELFDWPEGWLRAPQALQGREASLASFRGSKQHFIDTIAALSEEQIEETILSDGKETSRYKMAMFVALHNWYHSGQMNFIQTLRGDIDWHWNPG